MKKIKIVQTSDLHGFLYPSNYFEDKPIGIYGFKDELLDSDLIIDSGDLIQGSALTTYQSKQGLYKPNVIIDTLNAIGYDIFTFGNHEFNYGKEYLIESLRGFNGEIVCANIVGLDEIEVKPYITREILGLTIGVIGFVTPVIPYFEKEEHIKGIDFLDPVEVYGKYESELKEKCDIIIVNYHGGFEYDFRDSNPKSIETTKENQGIELVTKYDSIDILLSGHQHQVLCEKFKNTLIMQPGYAGAYFSKVEIDPKTKEVSGELVANPGASNPRFIGQSVELEENVQEFLNQPIFTLEKDMLVTNHFDARLNSCEYINFVHLTQLDATGADISVTSLFDTAQGFSKDITMRQIIANYPFANSLKVLKLHRDDIIDALEVCASYYEIDEDNLIVSDKFSKPKLQHYQYDVMFGFEYEFDIRKPVGSRVVKTTLEDRYYDVVMSNYRASNYGWYPMYEKGEVVKEISADMQELIMNFLTKGTININSLSKKNYKILF